MSKLSDFFASIFGKKPKIEILNCSVVLEPFAMSAVVQISGEYHELKRDRHGDWMIFYPTPGLTLKDSKRSLLPNKKETWTFILELKS